MAWIAQRGVGLLQAARGRSVTAVIVVGLLGARIGPALGEEPAVSDTTVEGAIRRAVTWLEAQRQTGGNWERPNPDTKDVQWAGTSALTVLALLYAGENPHTQFMESSLDWLVSQTLNGTYTHGTRAHALALIAGDKYRSRLEGDLKWLLDGAAVGENQGPGGYGYRAKDNEWDNSNSQYGVLGVWMAEDAGLVVPPSYWKAVGEHWMRCQQGDGGWTYKATGQSTGSMTAAGLASLYVVLDRAYGERAKEVAPLSAAIERGMNWFGREYTPENPYGDPQWLYYYLYGVERVGRASGYKYLRQKDWFREGATYLLKNQKAEGYWTGGGEFMTDVRNSCFALMFLCHGRAPLLFNKLEHGDDWNGKLRDVAGLTHFAQRALERLLNWQIVNLDNPLDDLLEAPVLYLCGQSAWEFTEVEVQKLREYCQRGGMILAVAAAGKGEFMQSMQALAEKTFPEFPVRMLSSEHPLFNGETQFAIDKPPPMLEVNDGARTLMLLSPEDIADAWSRGKSHREYAQLGCNIYNYATDKTSIRSRLETANIAPRQVEIRRKLEVALIKHAGQWSVEPYGWTRLKHYLNNETGTRLLVTSGLTFDSKELRNFKIAYITGTGAFELSAEEQKGLQTFLRNGGTVLADAAGGSDEFRKALERYLGEALKMEPKRLAADSFLLTGTGIPDAVDLASVGYTRASRARSSEKTPPLRVYDVGARLAAIYSPLDISAGLLGTPVYGRRGFDGEGALRIVRNMLLYAELPSREKARLSHP